ncbi:arabinosyltransferase domain-containing protein [Corynebacterium falsenii]|uniref:arabinosyltransferase domain-containing protein n=1 Tax=Corynebacterium falsenii TaxID=108486 RepID=UPI003FD16E27
MSTVQQQKRTEEGFSDSADSGAAAKRRRIKLISIVSGFLGFFLFLSIPFLPVKQEQASFSWPQGGDLTSVTAPLMSYVPQDLDISLPIEETTKLNPGATTVLSTVPQDAQEATLRGLFVRSTDNGLDVVIRNVVPLSIPKDDLSKLPANAVLRITSDSTKTHVWIPDADRPDGQPYDSTINDDIRPMLTGIYSEMDNTPANTQAAEAAGLKVDVKVDSRFTTSPSLIKTLAMWLGILATLVSLWALYRIDAMDGRRRSGRFLHKNWWKPRPLDAVVGFVLLAWYFVGANTADDGYLLTMAEESQSSGYMANFYRWFGVPESPFGSPYYDLLGLMVHVSTASIWMRLPSLIAGIITWLVLSREVMPRLGTKINSRRVAHWTMASMFLLFWMTYNNGTRPEPIIAMFSLLAWVSFERAIATRRLLPAAIGTILATLALGAGPTGLMAVAALLASLGSLIKIVIRRLPMLGAPKGSKRSTSIVAVLAQIAPFLASGTAILIAVFADQTFRTVMEAIKVRSAIGPSVPWYEEYLRYEALLEQTVDGSFPRRFSMLMLFFCFAVVIASMLRNGGRVPGAAKGPSTRLTLIILGTMFFMTFTPTKWTHHFGVYAGIGAALAGLAAVAASHVALRSRRNRILFIGASLLLFAFTLAGTNGWWYISSYGVPWWDKTIQLGGIQASSVMLALSLLVLVWGVLVGFLSDARHARAETTQDLRDIDAAERKRLRRFNGVAAAPIGVLTSIVVVFTLLSLTKGFIGQWPAYTVGKGNVEALTGNTCNLASDVLVEKNTNDSFLPVADGSPLKDSLTTEGSTGFKPNNIPAKIQAGSEGSSEAATATTQGDQFSSSDSSNTTAGSGTDKSGTGDVEASNQDSPEKTNNNEAAPTASSNPNDSGTTGGTRKTPGINGSYAQLPFGIDGNKIPVVGSYRDGLQEPAQTTTKWYTLPPRNADTPLIVFTAAGRMAHNDMNGVFQYGQEMKVQFGKKEPNGKFKVISDYVPLDIGTGPEWRNMRIPMSVVPQDATDMRIVAVDTNLTPDQWLAFTPPRAPEMEGLNQYLGKNEPGLLDWSTAFQFPCQRNYHHWAGVAEVPKFRISPDHSARRAHTPVMDYAGGGSIGLMQMTTQPNEVPTYLNNDWQRDWGVLDRLYTYHSVTGQAPKPAKLDVTTVTRSGLWYPGPMKFSS